MAYFYLLSELFDEPVSIYKKDVSDYLENLLNRADDVEFKIKKANANQKENN